VAVDLGPLLPVARAALGEAAAKGDLEHGGLTDPDDGGKGAVIFPHRRVGGGVG
jgi:hypothetical protein